MNFSKKSRYGLRALIDLSVYSKESHVALAAIAERNSISPQYLEQVFAALRKAGIIKSVKGPQASTDTRYSTCTSGRTRPENGPNPGYETFPESSPLCSGLAASQTRPARCRKEARDDAAKIRKQPYGVIRTPGNVRAGTAPANTGR